MLKTNKILVVAPAWVGDMIMAQALLKFLKQNNPAVVIDVLAPQYLSVLIERMPEVSQVISSPFQHGELNLRGRFALAKKLRSAAYDQAIVLPNSLKAALIPFWAKIRLRTGWCGEMRYFLLNDLRILDKKKLPLMVQRFVALGLPKGESLPDNIPMPRLMPKPDLIPPQSPVLALCVGAEYGPAKRWPPQYFAELAKRQAQLGWEIWLIGGVKDQPVAAEIQQRCNDLCKDFTGKTSLAEAIDLLSLASLVVTNDSGLMHVAAALEVPLIAIYGSSSPDFTPPLSIKAKILSLKLPCSPCFQRTCPLEHFKCMLELLPQTVIENIDHS